MNAYDNIVYTLALALGASWCAGINLYATLAVLGLMHRFVPGFQLPENLAVLGSHYVIWPAVFMYTVEFIADKVPAFDSVWDSVHTFIRIPAGAVLAGMAVGTVPPEIQVAAAVLGGSLAMGAHTAKATTRLAGHTTGTSLMLTPVASLVEDGLVIGTLGLMAGHPLISIALVALMAAAAVAIVWVFWSVAKRVFRSLFSGKSADISNEAVAA